MREARAAAPALRTLWVLGAARVPAPSPFSSRRALRSPFDLSRSLSDRLTRSC